MTTIVTSNGCIEISKDGGFTKQYPFNYFTTKPTPVILTLMDISTGRETLVETWGNITINGQVVTYANYLTKLSALFS